MYVCGVCVEEVRQGKYEGYVHNTGMDWMSCEKVC